MMRLSKQVHIKLDKMGFSRQQVWKRIHIMNKFSAAKDISTKRILGTSLVQAIYVGSQREGTGYNLTNDLDILQINHGVICKKDIFDISEQHEKVIFEMINKNAPSGYVYLRLVNSSQNVQTLEEIKYALVDVQNSLFLSSEIFMSQKNDIVQMVQGYIGKKAGYCERKGPSIPKSEDNVVFSYIEPEVLSKLKLKNSVETDWVRAFPCEADWILQAWCSRERRHNWPNQKTIAHVMSLPAHVVPVGLTGSQRADLQWRICFTLAEIHLVQSFNNTQTKLFVLLKLIAKHYLQPVCKDITSYVMKTVILWLAENIPQQKFRQKHLLARLRDALKYLQETTLNGNLPSYMIPDRNLFAGKLQQNEREHVRIKIDLLLNNGQELINDFINSPQESHKWVQTIYESHVFANENDEKFTRTNVFLSIEQLAEKFTTMFVCESKCILLTHEIFYDIIIRDYIGFQKKLILINNCLKKVFLGDQKKEKATCSLCMSNTNDTKGHQPDTRKYIDNTKADKILHCIFTIILLLECLLIDFRDKFIHLIPGLELILIFIIKNVNIYIFFFLYILCAVCTMKIQMTKQTYIQNNGLYLKTKTYFQRNLYYIWCITNTIFHWVCSFYFSCYVISHPDSIFHHQYPYFTIYWLFDTVCRIIHVLVYIVGDFNSTSILIERNEIQVIQRNWLNCQLQYFCQPFLQCFFTVLPCEIFHRFFGRLRIYFSNIDFKRYLIRMHNFYINTSKW